METTPNAASGTSAEANTQDTGLGVPPFRAAPPTPTKDPIMGRPPFAGQSANPPMPPSPPLRQPAPPVGRPSFGGGREPPAAAIERRTLVVGKGISVQGMVQDAERLVVEGTVEATLINASELAVSPGGVFRGEIEVEDAEVAGTIDGTVVARGNLIVRATGIVLGTARCRRLQVEDGGQITGRIEMMTDSPHRPAPSSAYTPAMASSAPAHSLEG
jgi:cytoskeletal protein CcmA (bactofilin family)